MPFHDPPTPLNELPKKFRSEAAVASRYSRAAGKAWTWAAEALEASLTARLGEVLSIAEAADEWGWSYEAVRRKVAGMPDLNAGIDGSPAIRRYDLPKLGAPKPRVPSIALPGGAAQASSVPAAPEAETKFGRIKARALSTP